MIMLPLGINVSKGLVFDLWVLAVEYLGTDFRMYAPSAAEGMWLAADGQSQCDCRAGSTDLREKF